MALIPETFSDSEYLSLLDHEYTIKGQRIIVVRDEKELKEFADQHLKAMRSDDDFITAVDTETEGIDAKNESPAFKGKAVCFTVYFGTYRYFLVPSLLQADYIGELFADSKTRVAYHNAKFDMHILANHGVDPIGSFFIDTIGLHACIDENQRHGLKELAKKDLGLKMGEYSDTFSARIVSKKTLKSFFDRTLDSKVAKYIYVLDGNYCMLVNTTPEPILNEYCIKKGFIPTNSAVLKDPAILRDMLYYSTEDPEATWKLAKKYKKYLMETPWTNTRSVWDLWMIQDRPMVVEAWNMERRGIPVDEEDVKRKATLLDEHIGELKAEVVNSLPEEHKKGVNLGGDNWKLWYLYEYHNLPVVATTKGWLCTECNKAITSRTGNVCPEHGTKYLVHPPAKDSKTLNDLGHRGYHDIVKPLIDYATSTNLLTGFFEKLPKFINPRSNRVHTVFNLWLVTMRFSSSKPNLLNIPTARKDKLGLRKSIAAPEGYKIICADYDQVESRVLAQLSQCPAMLQLFADKIDIHAATAVNAFKLDCLWQEVKELYSTERNRAKAINFGIPYGMGPRSLAYKIYVESGIPTSDQEAKFFIEAWLDQFPGARRWLEDREAEVNATGRVRTLLGRVRHLEGIFSAKDKMEVSAWERKAKNSPIQGSAAEVIKAAMLKIARSRELEMMDCKMILQVHDEIVLLCKEEYAPEAKEIVVDLMQNPFDAKLDVDLPVSGDIGDNWGDAKS